MPTDPEERLRAAVAAATAEIDRLRAENAALAETFKAEPTDSGREVLKRGAASLAAARDKLKAAKAALAIFVKSGTEHGLVAEDGEVLGSIAVKIPPGASREARESAIAAALNEPLTQAASELGATVSTAPERFVRERPGRDEEGRTVLDVAGRVEGDILLPAVSRAARQAGR